ncbi:hypothetical protein BLNAU_6354 [Blattamonas nauphoetae]|uniref:Uncharacterized protein n=1 Tax=Blattamonas nauphoetae TaxID=2049346 RepID=A0ABQ9Y4A5_9EUKA|nr:hypothetical protein BLNAU_6354 [Blattamonas nauphoetae]
MSSLVHDIKTEAIISFKDYKAAPFFALLGILVVVAAVYVGIIILQYFLGKSVNKAIIDKAVRFSDRMGGEAPFALSQNGFFTVYGTEVEPFKEKGRSAFQQEEEELEVDPSFQIQMNGNWLYIDLSAPQNPETNNYPDLEVQNDTIYADDPSSDSELSIQKGEDECCYAAEGDRS